MALKGNNNEEKIWNFLYGEIQNKYGVAGLMGNLYAESGLRPNNLENQYESKLGLTDTSYTEKVTTGSYRNFTKDSAGYGLAQWTYWSRKQSLLNYARSKNVSIDNLEMQLEYLIIELKNSYPEVWNTLLKAASLREASDIVLVKFENPADKSENAKKKRAEYGQNYYNKYSGIKEETAKKEADTIYNLAAKSPYAQYFINQSGNYISNSGGDERGKARGGQAGDQTGNEWTIRSWYNRPWDCVLRHPNIKVGLKIAELGVAAALNNYIGYNQGNRMSYWNCLVKAKYDPSKITTYCDSDCSAGVIANTKAVGYLLGLSALKNLNATYTGDMKRGYIQAGFQVLTDSKYLNGPDYLLPGDILLNEVHHTATNLTLGVKVRLGVVENPTPISYTTILRKGSTGVEVKKMQEMLIALGYNLGSYGADGDFGSKTYEAVRLFQSDHRLLVDGIYGPNTKAYLEQAYKEKDVLPAKPADPVATNTSFKKYPNLTEAQLKGIANIAYRENGEEAVSDEVSLMANLFELQTKYKTVYDYVRNSGWFGKAGNDMDNGYCTNSALNKVKDVLVNGNRTLPLWVNEHDCFSDLVYASNNGKNFKVNDRSQYIKDVTQIKNVYGAVYTFYKFPSPVADPFGYTAAAYNKYHQNGQSNPTPVNPTPAQPSGQTSGWKGIGTATSAVDNLNVRKAPNGQILRIVNRGNRFEVDGQKSGKWIHVNVAGTIGYIYEDYIIYD